MTGTDSTVIDNDQRSKAPELPEEGNQERGVLYVPFLGGLKFKHN